MFGILVGKELRAILFSPKFAVTFGVCSLLILLSVYTGIQEYRAARESWHTAVRLADDQAAQAVTWRHFRYKTLREPDPMRVFVSGLTNDIGRWSSVTTSESIKLRHSSYSDDPIFAMFRMIDFAFIVQIVLSLLAILFTYDAVSGERESGTLRLIFANGVTRAGYLLAKCTGAWLGLVVPIAIPVLLGVLLVIVFGVPMTSLHWLKLAMLVGVSLLFFTLFIVLGVLVSSLTRRSSVSFLVALVLWIGFVLIIPRAGTMAAGQMVHVPRVAEVEGKRDGFAKNEWKAHWDDMEERFEADRRATEEAGEGVDEDAAMWMQMEREDALRKEVEQRIEAYEVELLEDLRRRKVMQERLALSLSRFSPASSYQLAAMNLAGTDVGLKRRYEESMTRYREEWSEHVERKQAETGEMGGFVSIQIDSEKGISIGSGRDDQTVDLSDMPRYQAPVQSYEEVLATVVPDIGILSIGIILAFLGAFVAFLRYDVR